jgi:hypothetical protein
VNGKTGHSGNASRQNLPPSFFPSLYRSPIVRFTVADGNEVRVNELRSLPHHEGKLVLDVVAPDREIKISIHHGRYWVHCAITCDSVTWARLMAVRDTIDEARGTALWIQREPI